MKKFVLKSLDYVLSPILMILLCAFVVVSCGSHSSDSATTSTLVDYPKQNEEAVDKELVSPVDVESDAVYIPHEYVVEDDINSAEQLNKFIRENQGGLIIFPENRSIVLDGQLVLNHVKGTTFDFRGSALVFQDDFQGFEKKYIEDKYIGYSTIALMNCRDIRIVNLNIDGNKSMMSPEVRVYGMYVKDSKNVMVEQVQIYDVNFHGIVVSSGTEEITFRKIKFSNNYGSQNSSDVYVANAKGDSVLFEMIEAERDELTGNQVFYIDGYNTTINDLDALRCSIALDYRKGKHKAFDIYADDCDALIYIQSTSKEELPEVEISKVTGVNIQAGTNAATAIGIWSSSEVTLNNISIELDSMAVNAKWGVVIRRFGEVDQISKLTINNLKVTNARDAVVFYRNLNESTVINELEADNYYRYIARVDDTTAVQLINGLIDEKSAVNILVESFAGNEDMIRITN